MKVAHNHRSAASRRNLMISAIALAAMAVTAAAFKAASGQANAVPASAIDPTVRMVYLADPTTPAVAPANAHGLGVHVVTSPQDLIGAAADALLIDRSQLAQLPAGWLAAQYQASKVVVGLNVPSDELERAAAFVPGFELAPFRQDWDGRPFYSLLYRTPSDGAIQGVGRESDVIHTPGFLMGRVQRTVADVRADPGR